MTESCHLYVFLCSSLTIGYWCRICRLIFVWTEIRNDEIKKQLQSFSAPLHAHIGRLFTKLSLLITFLQLYKERIFRTTNSDCFILPSDKEASKNLSPYSLSISLSMHQVYQAEVANNIKRHLIYYDDRIWQVLTNLYKETFKEDWERLSIR